MTPQEKARQQFTQRFAAARKAHDFGPLLAEYEQAVREHPDDLEAARALYAVHFAMKRYDACLAELVRLENIARKAHAPERHIASIEYSRSIIHQAQHDYSTATADLERALQIDKNLSGALNSLAWLRATLPDPQLQNGDEAVQLAKRCVQVGGRHFNNVDTLAAAYAAQGKYERAVSVEKEAITLLNQEATDPKKAADKLKAANIRLNLYTHNEPDRETPPDPPS